MLVECLMISVRTKHLIRCGIHWWLFRRSHCVIRGKVYFRDNVRLVGIKNASIKEMTWVRNIRGWLESPELKRVDFGVQLLEIRLWICVIRYLISLSWSTESKFWLIFGGSLRQRDPKDYLIEWNYRKQLNNLWFAIKYVTSMFINEINGVRCIVWPRYTPHKVFDGNDSLLSACLSLRLDSFDDDFKININELLSSDGYSNAATNPQYYSSQQTSTSKNRFLVLLLKRFYYCMK